jgi:hypothetical protein
MSTTNDQQGSTPGPEPVAIFVSLELSRVRWLVTWTFHGSTKMSKTSVAAGDEKALPALCGLFMITALIEIRAAGGAGATPSGQRKFTSSSKRRVRPLGRGRPHHQTHKPLVTGRKTSE